MHEVGKLRTERAKKPAKFFFCVCFQSLCLFVFEGGKGKIRKIIREKWEEGSRVRRKTRLKWEDV